jgi:Xaa-Pro aminopeptidase
MDYPAIQDALRQAGLDGWLFCDFHNRDPISYRVLGLDYGKFTSRRWYYFIPAEGEPTALVHRVEPTKLDPLPGHKIYYLAWTELHRLLKETLGATGRKIAMQYSPGNAVPAVSTVDAGTVELLRGFGYDIVSSADLVQRFEAKIDETGYASHLEASELIYQIKDEAFAEIEKSLKSKRTITEYDIQRFILRRFDETGLDCCGELPIVGVNDHPANPHFEPTAQNAYPIKKGDTILIDLWAKLKKPGAIFADITWCGFAGKNPPERYVELFRVAASARDEGVRFIRSRFNEKRGCYGWEVDQAVRDVVIQAGWGDLFIHRTGHSIGEAVHGNGVNLDNLETRDERKLVSGVCFSIEPGIYLDGEMAVRTEINVFIADNGEPRVSGESQKDLTLLDV